VLLPGPENCNPQVFLFSTEGMAPGRHTGSLVAKDSEGREVSGRTVEFVVDPTPKRDACARALTLLRRLGFGPDPLELADLLILGENGWLESRLGNTLPGSETVNALTAIRMDNPNNAGTMVRIVLESAIASRNPVRSRFVFWAQNHFNTWHRKIGARPKWEEHLAFEKAGIARFPELLRISATSPAMLAYLDQNRSLRNRINENYAREILELHTVGVHGGYTQTDVTALAHLLTGWSFSEEAPDRGTGNFEEARFRFIAVSNSPEKQRVFGMEFPEQKIPDYDRISSLLEMLASHPATAQFIAKKLAAAYVSDPAPQALVRAMAVAYMESNGSMGATMAAMARHSEFWAEAEKPRLRHPLEHGIGIARQLQRLDTGRIQEYLDRSGAGLFDRATPDGYPTVDTSYLGSNAMLQRWKLAGDAAPQLLRVAGGPPKEGETPEAFIARLALVSNGRLPSPTSRAALMELLDKKNFTENSNPPLAAAELMLRLPESQLR